MNLSEGEKKRLMILRSLIYSPNILLLDEPLNFLDDGTSAIISIIREYKKGEGRNRDHHLKFRKFIRQKK